MNILRAKVKATGEIIEGFLDGKGHLDVPTDHHAFKRYNVEDLEIKQKSSVEEEIIDI